MPRMAAFRAHKAHHCGGPLCTAVSSILIVAGSVEQSPCSSMKGLTCSHMPHPVVLHCRSMRRSHLVQQQTPVMRQCGPRKNHVWRRSGWLHGEATMLVRMLVGRRQGSPWVYFALAFASGPALLSL